MYYPRFHALLSFSLFCHPGPEPVQLGDQAAGPEHDPVVEPDPDATGPGLHPAKPGGAARQHHRQQDLAQDRLVPEPEVHQGDGRQRPDPRAGHGLLGGH